MGHSHHDLIHWFVDSCSEALSLHFDHLGFLETEVTIDKRVELTLMLVASTVLVRSMVNYNNANANFY